MLWIFSEQPPRCSRCSHDADIGILLTRFNLVGEAVADSGDSEDETRPLGIWFDFLAQLGNIDVEAVRSGMRLGSPDLFEQLLPREKLAPVDDEDLEQVIFGGRQGNLSPVYLHTPLCEIGSVPLGAWAMRRRATRTRASTSFMPKGLAM